MRGGKGGQGANSGAGGQAHRAGSKQRRRQSSARGTGGAALPLALGHELSRAGPRALKPRLLATRTRRVGSQLRRRQPPTPSPTASARNHGSIPHLSGSSPAEGGPSPASATRFSAASSRRLTASTIEQPCRREDPRYHRESALERRSSTGGSGSRSRSGARTGRAGAVRGGLARKVTHVWAMLATLSHLRPPAAGCRAVLGGCRAPRRGLRQELQLPPKAEVAGLVAGTGAARGRRSFISCPALAGALAGCLMGGAAGRPGPVVLEFEPGEPLLGEGAEALSRLRIGRMGDQRKVPQERQPRLVRVGQQSGQRISQPGLCSLGWEGNVCAAPDEVVRLCQHLLPQDDS